MEDKEIVQRLKDKLRTVIAEGEELESLRSEFPDKAEYYNARRKIYLKQALLEEILGIDQ